MKRISLFTSILILFNLCVIQGQTDLNVPIQGICIYIDYPDAPANVTPDQLEGMMNGMNYQDEGVNRSFRKYWHQDTRRNFDIQHDIFYYTTPQPISYYSDGSNTLQMFKDALESVIANNPKYDWSKLSRWSTSDPYNVDNPELFDGAVKSAMVISSAWGPTHIGGAYSPDWTLSNGVKIGRLPTSSLQTPWWNTPYNLFMVIHESAHAIFDIPDTYDQDASSSGTGKYSLMSAQGPDVEPVGAPFLYSENWGYAIEPTEAGVYTYTLRADGDSIVVLKNIHDPEEYFMLEVRKNTTPGNSLFPVPIGLMIWHTDTKVHTLNTLEDATRYAHYRYSIIQKDGLFELEAQHAVPDAGDIYLPGDSFSDRSNPDANWWAGEGSGISIKRIQIVDENHIRITVVISPMGNELNEFIPKDNWTVVSETPSVFGFDGTKAFDGDPSTYYHVDGDVVGLHPHELVINLGAEYEISEFYYTANPDFAEPLGGRVKDYELYFSTNGVDWGEPVAAEQFFNTDIRQYELSADGIARYIKFIALSAHNSGSRPSMRRTSIAEIDLRGTQNILKDAPDVDENIVKNIKLSPNPVTNNLSMEGLTQDQVVRIYSPFGVLFKEIKMDGTSMQLDMSGYPCGVWMISVYNEFGNHISTQSIMKLK